MSLEHIDVSEEIQRFENHLNREVNKQIIFSGVFGIGKTYFIDKFFENKKDQYLPIKLNPVNYSVANNEDIFEYIKYDISFELLSNYPIQEYSKNEKSLNLQVYYQQNFKQIAWELLKNGSKVNQSAQAIFSIIETLVKSMKEAEGETPYKKMDDFFDGIENKRGSIYENDSISKLIKDLISDIKNVSYEFPIKPILIIDDLDRIDPEHIFRILNVFSAHIDPKNEDYNKLGFEKIILICDIQNVRKIFHYRFGSDTDFSGYIDKFYSTEIFKYNFKKIISKNLYKFFQKIEFQDDKSNHLFKNFRDLTHFLNFVIYSFFEVGALSTRSLINFLGKPFKLSNNYLEINFRPTEPVKSFFILEFLEELCGGEFELKSALKKASNKFSKVETVKFGIDSLVDLVILMDLENNHLKPSDENYLYRNRNLNFSLIYSISQDGFSIKGEYQAITNHREDIDPRSPEKYLNLKISYLPIFDILMEALHVKKRQTFVD
ncbi:P-loop NTPase fold protein [uncultured Salegentibacter sp.]|uniref:P-loop NTPase fold protein n=1 Tax=uncultured Salegentibacter sp. TaxID=259320 RepID=UPI0025937CF6|nr:P-loop NTPase fold protein [uncultured Salegentibacter sp.]